MTISSEPIPRGSKLLAITPADNMDTGDEKIAQPEVFELPASTGSEAPRMVQTWGIPWEPEQFVDEVVRAGHPMDMAPFLPPRLKALLDSYKHQDHDSRNRDRLSAMKFWPQRAMDLKNDERDFHDRLHPDVAKVLHGKRSLLWQQMLESIEYEDMGVVKEFAKGTPLVGGSEVTGLWPRKFKPASGLHDRDRPGNNRSCSATSTCFSIL